MTLPAGHPVDTFDQLHGSLGYSPDFSRSLRRRLPIFALVGAASLLLGFIPFPHQSAVEVYASGGLFFALTIVAAVIPWERVPTWFWPVIPIGYVAVAALLRAAQGGSGSGLAYLFLVPVVWLSLYGKRSHVAFGVLSVFLALTVPAVVVGGPQYPSSNWREILVSVVVTALMSFSFLAMGERDRAYVADLAEQSLAAQRSAREAQEARQQLDSILHGATETAIIGVDPQGIVTFFSTGAERLLGWWAHEVVGRADVTIFLDPADIEQRREEFDAMVRAVSTGSTVPVPGPDGPPSWIYRRRDGIRRMAAVTVTPRRVGGRLAGYVIVASDVTDRELLKADRDRVLAVQREVTASLVEQNHRLRELARLKEDIVGTVSHELRTPLTSIRGFVELLLETRGPHSDPAELEMLRTIDRNSEQLLRVAEDLLAEHASGHGLRVHVTDVDLRLLTIDALRSASTGATRRGVVLELDARQPVPVRGDPARLRQLLDNLLSNALKVSPPGGHIRATVDSWERYGRIQILDQGPGVPHADRPHLFERFFQSRATTTKGIPGTGLGLAIAKSVADAHDGAIGVVDTPGWSTTFRVLIPLSTEASDRRPTAVPVSPPQRPPVSPVLAAPAAPPAPRT